jgi:hypothetical protein
MNVGVAGPRANGSGRVLKTETESFRPYPGELVP